MKRYHFFTLTFLFFTLISFGQPDNFKEKKDKIKSLKIAFITEELSLTTDEAAKFWPVYNAFDEKQHELRKQKFHSFAGKADDNMENLSEKEALTLLASIESNEDELYQIRKKFVTNLKAFLPAVKIIKLKKAEEDFNRKLLKQYRGKKP